MAKVYTLASTLLDGLRDDILWLLILLYARRNRIALPNLGQMDREDFAVELVLLESANRDIVARLCALDDDLKGLRSFQTAFSAMKREGLDPKMTCAIDRDLKNFRKSLIPLKTEHRNTYIGHVQEQASVTPRISNEPAAVADSASRAVNLLDKMLGYPLDYHFHIGSAEAPINLRDRLSNHDTPVA